MRFFEDHRLPKPVLFGLLMAASFVMTMLPTETLSRLRGLAQLLGLPQWLMQTATLETHRTAMTLISRNVTMDQYQQLEIERDALLNEIAALRYQNLQLQTTVEELANVRSMGFPREGTLIPARVLAMDAAPGRDTMLVAKGNLQNVEKDDWVVSSLTVGAGANEGVKPQSHVLGRQCLIGWVDQTNLLTSRVILLSDKLAGKSRPRRVLIQAAGSSSRPSEVQPEVFVLEPHGGGRMIIRDIPRRMVDAGLIQVGDLVTSAPDDTRLPLAVVIGPIEDLQPNRDKPICFDALVRHMIDPASLSEVIIVDSSQPASLPTPSP
ncbi:MAG: rod shape-determining protein MreC [Phycisphaerae bacterium]